MNKPAFPHESPKEIFAGMSMLEYYAGQALTGLFVGCPEASQIEIVIISFNVAEMMIKEADKRKQQK